MVGGGIVSPVDKDQRGQDNVSREEVVGIGEEAGAGHRPDLPVEVIGIDVAADLVALVGIGLETHTSQFIYVSPSGPS